MMLERLWTWLTQPNTRLKKTAPVTTTQAQLALSRAIASRQQAELERDRFFELSLDMLVIASFDAYFIHANPALQTTIGYTLTELRELSLYDMVHPEDVAATLQALESLLADKPLTDVEIRVRCRDGAYKWIAWSARTAGDFIYAVGRDITQRKQAAAAVHDSEQRYRLLFENTGLATIIYNPDGVIQLINQAAALNFARRPEDLIGRSVFEVFPLHEAQRIWSTLRRTALTGQREAHEETVTLDSEERHQITTAVPMFNAEGQVTGVQVISQDVTALKRMEKQERELALAREKNAFLSEFLGNISHDLKTPLTVIKTCLYLVERLTDPAKMREKMLLLKEQTQLVEKFIQDILTVSRLEYLPELDRSPCNVNTLLDETVHNLLPRAERKQLQLRVALSANVPDIDLDPREFKRVFVNLVENAVNYTPNGGSVDIVTAVDVDAILVEIRDSGMGIAPEDLPHIFDRFYRADQARTVEQSGTGLGLAIVKKIVDMHACDLTVTSQLEVGTTFRIRLPRQHTAAQAVLASG